MGRKGGEGRGGEGGETGLEADDGGAEADHVDGDAGGEGRDDLGCPRSGGGEGCQVRGGWDVRERGEERKEGEGAGLVAGGGLLRVGGAPLQLRGEAGVPAGFAGGAGGRERAGLSGGGVRGRVNLRSTEGGEWEVT